MPTPNHGRDLPRPTPVELPYEEFLDAADCTARERLERHNVPAEVAVEVLGRGLLALEDGYNVHALDQPIGDATLVVHADETEPRATA